MREYKEGKEKRCTNCNTKETPMWRRSWDGKLVCNACGLYYRNHRGNRPINVGNEAMNYNKIASIKRNTSAPLEHGELELLALGTLINLKSTLRMAILMRSSCARQKIAGQAMKGRPFLEQRGYAKYPFFDPVFSMAGDNYNAPYSYGPNAYGMSGAMEEAQTEADDDKTPFISKGK